MSRSRVLNTISVLLIWKYLLLLCVNAGHSGNICCCYISHTFDLFLSTPAYLHLLSTLTCSTLPLPPSQPHPTPLQAWPPFWCQQWDSECTSPLPPSLSSSYSYSSNSSSNLLLSLFLLLFFPPPAGPASPPAATAAAAAVQLGEQRGSTGEVATTPPASFLHLFFSIALFWSRRRHHRLAWGTFHPASAHFRLSSCVEPSHGSAFVLKHVCSVNCRLTLKSDYTWLVWFSFLWPLCCYSPPSSFIQVLVINISCLPTMKSCISLLIFQLSKM